MDNHILPNQEVVGNTDRTGDKTLNLQQFFAMSFGLSVENIYYIAIAVLACVLGAEIAGICMLIGKMRRARNDEADASNDEYNRGGGAGYAIGALSFGAVSATAELALLVLAIAAAVGAFVLLILLAVLYAKGYLLISAKAEKMAAEQKAATPAYAPVEEPAPVYNEPAVTQAVVEEVVDEPVQERTDIDYVANYEDDEEAQKALSNLTNTESAVMSEEVSEEEPVEEPVEEPAEEPTQEPAATDEVAVIAAEAPAAPVAASEGMVERTVAGGGVPGYAGQAPIIEKHIIETTKEVIKETNTHTVTTDKPATDPVSDRIQEAIDVLKQMEAHLRLDREVAVTTSAQEVVDENDRVIDIEEKEVKEAEDLDDVQDTVEGDNLDEEERKRDEDNNDDEYESDLFGDGRIVGFDEETGYHIIARYRKSCEAKLIQARPETKKYYSAIRNALMGYEGTKERMSWSIDTYTNEHTQIAKINVRPRTLDLYLALDPSTLEDSVYRGRDVGDKRKYYETPFLYKVNSPRKLALALELVQRTCEEQGLSPIDIEEVNYSEQYPFTDTATLISRQLVREYLREEKPAATFELDPDHVPQLVEEDATVIPANANFTWEFDNDQPEVEETVAEEPVAEEPVEEPVVEESVIVEEPAPVEEPAHAAPVVGTTTTTTTHETIRTTERHYTERYYGTGTAAQITEESRTIEVLPETATAPIEAEAEEIAPEVVEQPVEEQPTKEAPAAEVAEEPVEEEIEEVSEEVAEETEEVIEEVTEEEPAAEETTEETVADEDTTEVQSSVAALFGEDVNEEDEPIESEPEAEEEAYESEPEAEEEVYESEPEAEEEVYESEPEAEEEVYDSEPEAEEEVYESEPEAEEEVYESEPEAEEEASESEPEAEEEVYESEPEAEEEVYESESEAEEDGYYYAEESEDENQEVYENFEENEYEDAYEEEEPVAEDAEEELEEEIEEEVEEEVEEAPAPAPAPRPIAQTSPDVVLLDVCVFDDYFENGAVVNLETLKQVGLAQESATRLKLYATGPLKGEFIVEANHFTIDAIRAIGEAGGDSVMIR